jgi:NAD kinase
MLDNIHHNIGFNLDHTKFYSNFYFLVDDKVDRHFQKIYNGEKFKDFLIIVKKYKCDINWTTEQIKTFIEELKSEGYVEIILNKTENKFMEVV